MPSSENITVIPAAERTSSIVYNGALLTEYNITRLIRALTDKENFVISDDKSRIKFVMDGHYFELRTTDSTVYAKLNYTGDDDDVYKRLDGDEKGDDNTLNYKGLLITSDSNETGYFALRVGGETPPSSMFKFSSASIEEIDGGII